MTKKIFSRRNFIVTFAASAGTLAVSENASAKVPRNTAEEPVPHKPNAGKPAKILVTEKLAAEHIEKIRSAGKNATVVIISNQDELKRHIEDAHAILGPVDAGLVSSAKQLTWVQTFAAGVENMSKELKEHPCLVTNMQRVFAPVIAESAIALLLSLTRGLAQVSIPAFSRRKWIQPPANIGLTDLYDKTIAIVGMGGIGSETAQRLHYGFKMKVLATDAKPLPKPDFVDELHDPAWLIDMVPQVDVLMSAAPLTPETKLMFNAAVFNKMKPSAYFINVSRGGLVDQDALVKALKEERIKGAGLDVTTPEPLPEESPLWDCPNLVITPHNSTVAPVRMQRAVALATENVRRYCNELPLLNVVDKIKGY
jgi:phosphoglycerate dehydrogenase-like enzyme